ncbi:hypothetical protein, partial [Endozoicomonas atrinae]|uniref:hypothetical protein n=1 Tax=Endozoicomonas atrinae TaxID=1333660 RepID=UPI000A7A892A
MKSNKLTNPKLNALRANVNAHTLAYLDQVIELQQQLLDELISQHRTLHEQINECRLHIDSINAYLDNNAEYSLTKAKLARLIKKL